MRITIRPSVLLQLNMKLKFSHEGYGTVITCLEYCLEKAKGEGDEIAMKEIELAMQEVDAISSY